MLPSRQQWRRWTLPTKLTAIGVYAGILSVVLSVLFYVLPPSTTVSPVAEPTAITPDLKTRRVVFRMAFDTWLVYGLALQYVTNDDPERSMQTYFRQRYVLIEECKTLGFDPDLPATLSELTGSQVTEMFQSIDLELRTRLDTREPRLGEIYRVGTWLGQALVAAAGAQVATPEQVVQLFDPVISRYDEAARNLRLLESRKEIHTEFAAIHQAIVQLKNKRVVSRDDYSQMADKIPALVEKILN